LQFYINTTKAIFYSVRVCVCACVRAINRSSVAVVRRIWYQLCTACVTMVTYDVF